MAENLFARSALQVDTLLVAHDEAVEFRWAVITARCGKIVIPLSVSVNTGLTRWTDRLIRRAGFHLIHHFNYCRGFSLFFRFF